MALCVGDGDKLIKAALSREVFEGAKPGSRGPTSFFEDVSTDAEFVWFFNAISDAFEAAMVECDRTDSDAGFFKNELFWESGLIFKEERFFVACLNFCAFDMVRVNFVDIKAWAAIFDTIPCERGDHVEHTSNNSRGTKDAHGLGVSRHAPEEPGKVAEVIEVCMTQQDVRCLVNEFCRHLSNLAKVQEDTSLAVSQAKDKHGVFKEVSDHGGVQAIACADLTSCKVDAIDRTFAWCIGQLWESFLIAMLCASHVCFGGVRGDALCLIKDHILEGERCNLVRIKCWGVEDFQVIERVLHETHEAKLLSLRVERDSKVRGLRALVFGDDVMDVYIFQRDGGCVWFV